MPSFQPVKNFNATTLAYLGQKISHQKAILKRIKSVLPHDLANHALHCVINEKKLILYTDAAAWGSQLRFYDAAILNAINNPNTESVTLVQIRLQENRSAITHPNQQPVKLPNAQNISHILATSQQIADKDLSTALEKLAHALIRLSSSH
ncbi:MAG: DciA family protein [Methylococcaceae bacterium]|jgi:hypothetical protein